MKVYGVFIWNYTYHGEDLVAELAPVFSTKEKAEAYASDHKPKLKWFQEGDMEVREINVL